MKPSQVNCLYAKLTPAEQATLFFEAAVQHDWNTADAIMKQVERKTYATPNAEYLWRVNSLQLMAMHYGIEYWKNRTMMLLCLNYADAGHSVASSTAMKFLAKAVALDEALFEVCKPLKVEVDAIKTMAGCIDIDALPKELPLLDESLVKEYAEVLASLIPR